MPDVSPPPVAPLSTEALPNMAPAAPSVVVHDPNAMPAYTHQQILRVVTGIMLCIFLASLDQTVVIPAVPAIAGDLNAFGPLSWNVTAYLLTSTAATPIIGKLSDIYGRRALLLPSLALFVVASLGCGFAQTLPQLIVARAVQGLGGAGLFAMAQAAIADVVAPRERGRYQAYMASMWGVSSIAGPILGGWVTDQLSWRWIFWANLPLGLLAMLLCNRALQLIRHQRRPALIDWGGAGLLVLAVTAWLLLLSWGGTEYPWASAPILALGALGVVLPFVLRWHEGRAADPILPPRLFANPTFLRGVLIAFFTSLGLFGATFLLPLYFQLVLGFDASTSGLLVVPYLSSTVVGALVSGQMARRVGRVKGIVLTGLSFVVLGFAGLTLMTAGTPLWLVLPCTFFLGVGTGMTMPTVLMQVQNAAERRDVGAATGSLLFLRSMGGAFGSTVVGTVLAMRFNAGLQAAGVTAPVDLGSLRGGSALDSLGGAAMEVARAALGAGFRLGYGVCAGLLLIALLIALGMRDLPLKSSAAVPKELGH
jgi:EmrB/QacA subfamily drug resistance transporter